MAAALGSGAVLAQVAHQNLASRRNYLASRRNFAVWPKRDCPHWVRRRHFPARGVVGEWFSFLVRPDFLAGDNPRELVARRLWGVRAHWAAWRHLFPGWELP